MLHSYFFSLISMGSTMYDFAIIGAGAAGLNLALCMLDDPYFNDKKIALFDKDLKQDNDKTWCFWEKGKGSWDHLVAKKWQNATITGTDGQQHTFNLSPFSYKMIHALDFYDHARERTRTAPNITWIHAEVEEVRLGETITISASGEYLIKNHVFDSRINPGFYDDQSSVKLLQHFKGWVIETPQEVFDDSSFVMMDFNTRWKDTTSFIYVLPHAGNKALVEFTLFSPSLIGDEDYDGMIERYLSNVLKLESYKINATEKGIIPMSDYAFHKENSHQLTKIGTAGSWVKPSSGYSFKNAGKMSLKIVENIKRGALPSKGLIRKKFRFYDALFLDVLYNKNDLGPKLFTIMYCKNSIQKIFSFLNEETNLLEDLGIMNSFPKAPFNKALAKRLYSKAFF